MAIEQLKVHEIVKQAVSKNVDIPEFQREFVWDPEQVKKLAESLYRNYPVGSFLLWDSSEYQEAKTAEGTPASLWIVDGQQRTTALCLLFGQKPYWWNNTNSWNEALERYDVMINLPLEDGEEHLEFALPNPIRRKDPRWISIRDVLKEENSEALTQLAQKAVESNNSPSEQIMQRFGKVHARLQSLWQIRERDIPIIKISHEVEDVAEIFARLNQEGTRVKEADVILALAAVRNPGWVREEYLPFRNELENRGWDLDAGVLVRTMTGIAKGRASLREVPKDFWSSNNLRKACNETKENINQVLIKRLTEFGITSVDLLPSANSLIPLIVLHHHWHDKSNYRFERALCWFLLANRDGRYSGAAITSLNEDLRAIKEAKDFDEALENLRSRLRVSSEIDGDEFLKNRYNRASSRFLRLMLYLLIFRRNARDWVDKTRIGYDKGSMVTAGFEPQWHHIYPRSFLKNSNTPDNEIHCLANITVLNERTNVRKLSSKPPSEYIQEFTITTDSLQAHLIPDVFAAAAGNPKLLEDLWSVGRYKEFITERARLLAEESNKFLEELCASH